MQESRTCLKVYAGSEALAHIQQHGLQASDISMLLGASSGPKWLVLHGIDQWLMRAFFNTRHQALHLLGTSAGAWRMAAYAQQDNLAAHERLTEAYIKQCYSDKPAAEEVLATCRSIIRDLLGEQGAHEILQNPYVKLNLITTQCHGLTAANLKLLKTIGFGAAALMNKISRKTLGKQFTRVVMHHPDEHFSSGKLDDLPTRYAPLSEAYMEDAILSTGSIPLIIEGVRDVAGEGLYQDGGITDYGFDLPLLLENKKLENKELEDKALEDKTQAQTSAEGFVLYPHFAKYPAPGWFDKSWLRKNHVSRKPSLANYARTIMLVPSDDFVAKLPYGKIPDRHDFLKLSDQERMAYWRKTIALTQTLADDLDTIDWQARVEPLPW